MVVLMAECNLEYNDVYLYVIGCCCCWCLGMCGIDFFILVQFSKNSDSVWIEFGSVQFGS